MTDQTATASAADINQNKDETAIAGPSSAKEQADLIFGTIKLMITTFSILFALLLGGLGFFGWRTVSNIDKTISSTVDLRVGQIISGANGEVAPLNEILNELSTNVSSAREDVKLLLGGVADLNADLTLVREGQTDPVGDYLRILNDNPSIFNDVRVDPQIRKNAESVFNRLVALAKDERVSGEIIFNAAATASEFRMTSLGAKLAEAAFEAEPTPEHEARMLRFQIGSKFIDEEEGYKQMFSLVSNAKRFQMHLTLSEAFNANLVGGRLVEFTEALDALKAKLGGLAPSYIWALQADTLLLIGGADELERAAKEVEIGLQRLSTESPRATWYDASVGQLNQVLTILEKHGSYSEQATKLREKHAAYLTTGGDTTSEMLELLRILSGEPGIGEGSTLGEETPSDFLRFLLEESATEDETPVVPNR